MPILTILGRQPELSLAELESLVGNAAVKPLSRSAALVDADLPYPRLGGTLKAGLVLAELPVGCDLSAELSDRLQPLAQGKLRFGLSFYGERAPRGLGIEIKKRLRDSGVSARAIPTKGDELNAAQVLYNKLTAPGNAELLIVRTSTGYTVARTEFVQDIDAYTERDRAKPVRDMKVGMLPPKLAQIIINLAHPAPDARVLDPFCGTGTVLMEAALMGFVPYGSDLSPEMVLASRQNYDWLRQAHTELPSALVEEADATTHTWLEPIGAVAAETYLGPPLFALPKPDQLDRIINEVDALHRRFFTNLAKQLPSGAGLCLAVPAWSVRGSFRRLPLIDEIERFGYNRASFVHAGDKLIYHRPDQVVARELVVLRRK